MHILHSTPMCVYSQQQPSLGIFVWNILLISPKGEKDSSSSAIVPTRYAVLVETQTRRPTSPKSLSNLQKIRSKGGENEEKGQRVEVKSGTYWWCAQKNELCCSVLQAPTLSIALDLCSYISFSFRVSIAPIVSTKAGGWASERILMNFSTNHWSLFILFFCEPICYIMIDVRALINWCACYGLWREDDVIYKGRWVSADERCHCVVMLLIFPHCVFLFVCLFCCWFPVVFVAAEDLRRERGVQSHHGDCDDIPGEPKVPLRPRRDLSVL